MSSSRTVQEEDAALTVRRNTRVVNKMHGDQFSQTYQYQQHDPTSHGWH